MDDTLLAARLVLYALFQRAFASEPDDDLFDLIGDEVSAEAVGTFVAALDEEEGRAFEDAFRRFHGAALDSWRGAPDRVRADYTRLLVGPAALPAPPWESAFRHGALFQTSTLEVRRAYAAQGLAVEGGPRIADDHVATELDFMRTLSARAIASLHVGDVQCGQRCIEAQQRFLDEHLLVWVGSFSDALAREQAAVYPACGALLGRFVQLDSRVLARKSER